MGICHLKALLALWILLCYNQCMLCCLSVAFLNIDYANALPVQNMPGQNGPIAWPQAATSTYNKINPVDVRCVL